jgi:hypothetical protein
MIVRTTDLDDIGSPDVMTRVALSDRTGAPVKCCTPGPQAPVNRAAEPPAERLVKRERPGDDVPTVAHLFTLVSACVLMYGGVTRGGLAFARLLERIVRA